MTENNKPLKQGDDFTEGKSFFRWLLSGQRIALMIAMLFFMGVVIYAYVAPDSAFDGYNRVIAGMTALIMFTGVILLTVKSYRDAKKGIAR